MMKVRLLATVTVLALGMMATGTAHADMFGSGENTFTLDFVTVGNPGNAAQSAANRSHSETGGDGYGAVPHEYRMSTYAISQNDITTATAAGLLNVTAGAHTGDRPAANISWYEAAAFVNWLNTSQGHQAAYDLTWGGSSWSMALWSSEDAWQSGGENRFRHKDAYYFLPSEDEWYKAAFFDYDPDDPTYYLYATGSDTAPTAVASGTTADTAVYGGQSGPADVNQSGGLSPYGTMGQGGNVWEWSESASDGSNNSASGDRAVRGGFWLNTVFDVRSSGRLVVVPTVEVGGIGFRVASIPEPSTTLLVLMAGGALLLKKRLSRSL